MKKPEIVAIEGVSFYIQEIEKDDLQVLIERKVTGDHLIGNYSIHHHQPHTTPGEYHIHYGT